MKLKVNLEGMPVPVSQKLIDIFNDQLVNVELSSHPLRGIVVCFKDSTYSVETGGYHPVEIAISSDAEGGWQCEYITDFANSGGPFPELVKNINFDFLDDSMTTVMGIQLPLKHRDSRDFYQLWEANFISYYEMGSYDKVEVTPYI